MFPILLLINVVLCEAEWIKISQIPTSEFQMYTTPSTVNAAEIVNSNAPIKYEDLEHIIGPGFEDELEKFYQRHKSEVERKRPDDRPKNKGTATRPAAYEDDPWSVYDNPVHISVINEPINVADVSDTEQDEKTMLNDKHRYEEYDETDRVSGGSSNENHERVTMRPVTNRYEEYDETDHVSGSSNENYENVTRKRGTPAKVVQVKFVKATPTVEPFSFGGFIKFLRDIQSTFVSKTARSIKDKIRTLEQFRDDILINIHDRIQNLWSATPVIRSKRGIIDGHHGGGMEFPSSEGALMTISFLTFAVFLIKLVLQVINTIKSKHYSMDKINGAMSAVKINRNARSLSMTPDDLNGMTNILRAIDNVTRM
ncbi:uncharacterized protein LOC119069694 [Bradysia coprophila]|uniref:uncharacterized protein LOC119069694 n=1 Tax=Bradysia coprophila TaxID=38358 RepID=UPI00187DD455|nr:uncharacterized protein LOC119069694 [Bradysia coprophila]